MEATEAVEGALEGLIRTYSACLEEAWEEWVEWEELKVRAEEVRQGRKGSLVGSPL